MDHKNDLFLPVIVKVGNYDAHPQRNSQAADIIARIMAASMQEAMPGSSFIVENKGGAGGNIGMGYVARSDADGYTILLSTSAFSVNPGLYNQLVYDPFKDFAPICELAVSPHVFAVQPSLGVKTMKEFVELAKALAANTPKKGDADKWKERTATIVAEAEKGEKQACATNCKGCHDLQAGSDGRMDRDTAGPGLVLERTTPDEAQNGARLQIQHH